LRTIVVLGLAIYTIVACSRVFIKSVLSSPFFIFWFVGYLILSFAVSYVAYVAREGFKPLPAIVLGIILLNFLVQVGGARSSLWPAYFLFAVLIAILSPPRRTKISKALMTRPTLPGTVIEIHNPRIFVDEIKPFSGLRVHYSWVMYG